MKTSEMEIPRAEEKAKLKQVGLACLYLAIGTEIMGPMWNIMCKAIMLFKIKFKWMLANKMLIFSSRKSYWNSSRYFDGNKKSIEGTQAKSEWEEVNTPIMAQ